MVEFYDQIDTPEKPAFLTPFSLVHVFSGLLAYVLLRWLFPRWTDFTIFWIWFILHGLYEVKDVIEVDSRNSIENSIGDHLASLIGFFIGAATQPTPQFGNVVLMVIVYYLSVRVIDEPADWD